MTIQSKEGYIPEKCTNLDHFPHVKGYEFSEKFDFKKFIKSYGTTGFQGTNLSKGIEIIKVMNREKAKIYLSYTSNMITSGNREIIKYLVKEKKVAALITTAGGIEEDLIKCLKPFVIGKFSAPGKMLFDEGVNRTGNIFVTNDRYVEFEKFMRPILEKVYLKQKKTGKIICTTDLIKILGQEIKHKESVLYWAAKNGIPVYCPTLTDGSLGDMIYWTKQRHMDFKIDITDDMVKIVNSTINAEKTGVIALGGGSAKHYNLNAQIFREGCDYAVYINTGSEFDGSDSGACPDEAITWGKIKPDSLHAKIHGDATIIFPLVIAGVLNT